MRTKFSEDIIPISDLKVNPGKVVSHVNETHRPVLLTKRGRGVAVVQSLNDYENEVEKHAFMQDVVEGLVDLEEDSELSIKDVKDRLGLK